MRVPHAAGCTFDVHHDTPQSMTPLLCETRERDREIADLTTAQCGDRSLPQLEVHSRRARSPVRATTIQILRVEDPAFGRISVDAVLMQAALNLPAPERASTDASPALPSPSSIEHVARSKLDTASRRSDGTSMSATSRGPATRSCTFVDTDGTGLRHEYGRR